MMVVSQSCGFLVCNWLTNNRQGTSGLKPMQVTLTATLRSLLKETSFLSLYCNMAFFQ